MPSPIKQLFDRIPPRVKSTLGFVLKAFITFLAFYLLLSHQVQMVDHRPVQLETGDIVNLPAGSEIRLGNREVVLKTAKEAVTPSGEILPLKPGKRIHLPDGRAGKLLPLETKSTFSAIMDYLPHIRASTFWTFVFLAAFIKFIGILSSMYRWHLLLQGQGIKFPFKHIAGSFLIGRFLGTFLPSTIGLDGYKLYDATRFSHKTVEATAATVIEKVLGIVGIFITFLVALPFGIGILGDKARQIALITVPVAVGVIGGFFLLLFYPAIVRFIIEHLPIPGRSRLEGFIHRVSNAASAYRDKKLVLLNAAFQSFMVHFCTAAMYFFTALAIGAVGATFWQVTFASSIQIFATVISPITIAGEGIREIAQYYLLRNQLGPAESIVSAALGFWAAEALTLVGGIFWWLRKKGYKPAYLYLDGRKADIDAIMASDDYGLEELQHREEKLDRGWMRTAFFSRLAAGLSGGFLAGVLMGLLEGLWILAVKGTSLDIFPYGMVLYGLIGAGAGLAAGIFFGLTALALGHLRGTVNTFALTLAGWFSLNLLIIGKFRLFRDVWKEHALPLSAKLMLLVTCGVVFLALLLISRTERRERDRYAVRPALLGAALIALAVLAWGVSAAIRPGPANRSPNPISENLADRPNVVLIMCDALRADHLSCYGYNRIKTPVIDALADEGVRFHEAYSQASWTKPGTACIFTARYPSGHHTYEKPDVLPDKLDTIAEVFHSAGYYTVGFPNNINIAPDFNFGQGFDEYNYLAPDYFFYAPESGSQLSYYNILRVVRERFLVQSKYPEFYYQEAEVVNRHVFEYLDRRGKKERFFMYIHYMEAHDPYFKHPFNGVGYARVNMPNPPPEMADELAATYDEEIEYLDMRLGELFDGLKKRGLWNNTIVLLTADHGEEFYEHEGWWHGTSLYQEVIRIPMIIKFPDDAHAGSVRIDKARQIDIAPTLLSLCHIPPPSQMILGRNLFRPGNDALLEWPVYAEENFEGNELSCLIRDSWKYIRANKENPRGLAEHELYRLDIDPLETRNLAKREEDRRREMEADLDNAHELASKNAVERQVKTISTDEILRMQALGYVTVKPE